MHRQRASRPARTLSSARGGGGLVLPPLRDQICYLRPLMPDDYDSLYGAEVLDPVQLVTYRHRGVPPSAETYPQTLWLDVFTQFVVSPIGEETVSGLVTCYALNERNRTAKLALTSVEAAGFGGSLAMRGLLLLIDYLFEVHPIRKLYGEVLSWNRHQFDSMVRHGASIEGCLAGHELHGDAEVDLFIYGLSKEAWQSRKTEMKSAAASYGSPTVAVLSVLNLPDVEAISLNSLDSLDRVVITSLIEDEFGVLIPDDLIHSGGDQDLRSFLLAADEQWRARSSASLP